MNINILKVRENPDVQGFYPNSIGFEPEDHLVIAKVMGKVIGAVRFSQRDSQNIVSDLKVTNEDGCDGLIRRILRHCEVLWDDKGCYWYCPSELQKHAEDVKFEVCSAVQKKTPVEERWWRSCPPKKIPMKRSARERPSRKLNQEVVKSWGFSGEALFIRKVENFVYELDQQPIILRITPERHRSQQSLLAELRWIQDLKAKDVPVALPIVNPDDQWLVKKNEDHQTLFAAFFEKASGQSLAGPQVFQKAPWRRLGEVLGKIHCATQSFPKTPHRCQWNQEEGYLLAKSALDEADGHVFEKFHIATKWAEELPKDSDSFGLIHGDLHHGNFFVDESGVITIFDFDDSHYSWFGFDLAVPLVGIYCHSRKCNQPFHFELWRDTLLAGYREFMEFDEELLMNLHRFFQLRLVILYYWAKARIRKKDLEPDGLKRCKELMSWCGEALEEPF